MENNLFYASRWNQIEKARYLLENRVQWVNQQDRVGETPLHVACKYGDIHIVRLLLKHGADISICSNALETPLHRAVRKRNNVKVIRLLLKMGCHPNQQNAYGETPLMIASKFRLSKNIKCLYSYYKAVMSDIKKLN